MVRHVLVNERIQSIIAGIHRMALSLNYQVIAEHVETKEQKEKQEELGCCIYQGYFYSLPVPLDELEISLRSIKNSNNI